jgi:hypothetical protein
MSKRVTRYEVEPVETVILASSLGRAEQNGLHEVISHTIETQGLEWVDGAGHLGLDAAMAANISDVKPSGCERSEACMAEVDFDSRENGVVDGYTKITLRCPGASFASAQEAGAFEAKEHDSCAACQQNMAERMVEWLGEIPHSAEVARQKVGEAVASLVLARNALSRVFDLE